MKSIRLYLLLILVATLILVMFVSLLKGYQSSIDTAQRLFDERLVNTAELIASAHTGQTTADSSQRPSSDYLFFQIWNTKGQLLTRSDTAPHIALSRLEKGFDDVNFNGFRWHNYVHPDPQSQRWIIVGERSDVRSSMAEDIVLATILPAFFGILIAAILIWWLIGTGLKPLKNLSKQLASKQADDLKPVELAPLPSEMSQLVKIINQLFWRLDQSFQREQRFAADAAHELRTPISALQIHLHNLRQTYGDNSEDWQLMQAAVDRMGHLVNQILMLYRTAPEQIAAKAEQIDLYKLTSEVIARDYQQFEKRLQHIELIGESAMMHGHLFALETLLQNLLNNASKYAPTNGHIVIHVHPTEKGVRLTIEDDGPGIPADQYERIFDRFYRYQNENSDLQLPGCGLGLAIVQHIIEMHHADIKLTKSAFESGLKVVIDFPAALNK
ncbi:sensor histidine kinase [Methylophaga frappieri]|jgi:two-component system sensor histidine kinase QseC|uniref:histidine kinase n=1 Tax=Methylophaga frappieri (strain ATCC BAA-2434 / DSM 25690 / JAM7) TaxID=754477 RepID=I1YED4_METFJ|nr:ATP-binding protein [Methylophaga frappieri]AFJ01277.1 sensor histidine kinase [Methylophaga frappieri]